MGGEGEGKGEGEGEGEGEGGRGKASCETGRGSSPRLLVVTLRFKRLCERRRLVLSFCPQPFRRNVKEAAMLYLDAASGDFYGMHVAPERRGGGLAKIIFAYYVCFCRFFGLPALATAHNKKPAFARLFQHFGYSPASTDYPFLLVRTIAPLPPSDAQSTVQSTADDGQPLPSAPLPAPARGGTQYIVQPIARAAAGHRPWSFAPSLAQSQGVIVAPTPRASDEPLPAGAVLLYAHTTWTLPASRRWRHGTWRWLGAMGRRSEERVPEDSARRPIGSDGQHRSMHRVWRRRDATRVAGTRGRRGPEYGGSGSSRCVAFAGWPKDEDGRVGASAGRAPQGPAALK